MRLLSVFFAITIFVFTARSQSVVQNRFPIDGYYGGFTHRSPLRDSIGHSKWSFNKYASLSAGYSFFSGSGASFVALPVGVQLNRELNKNLYAFAGISAAPTFINFNNALLPSAFMKADANTSFMKTNIIGAYSRAQLGLMYINDAKTFSISGSIGVERSSTPMYYPGETFMSQNPVGVK